MNTERTGNEVGTDGGRGRSRTDGGTDDGSGHRDTGAGAGNGGALAGIEVVEIATAIAGPFVGRLLADHGANVTKVEPLDGAPFRSRPLGYDTHGSEEFVYRFMAYNSGKTGVAVDLKREEGAGILWELLGEADVLLVNMRPGVMDRLGFPWETVHERHPELIYCSVTGYGEDGPYRDWPAMDPTVAAVSGWSDQLGLEDRPEVSNVFAIDHATALYATVGILMALLERGASGEGQRVDVSMFDAAVSFLGHHLAEHSGARNDPDVAATYRGHFAPNDVYEVADGYLALFVPPEVWDEFCAAIDRPELADDPRFATVGDRVANQLDLRSALEPTLRERPAGEWVGFFDREVRGVVAAPANRMAEVPSDPHVEARDLLVTREHPELGDYTVPRTPLRFSRSGSAVGPVPGLGEHTDTVLRALGYDPDEIDTLREGDVVR